MNATIVNNSKGERKGILVYELRYFNNESQSMKSETFFVMECLELFVKHKNIKTYEILNYTHIL